MLLAVGSRPSIAMTVGVAGPKVPRFIQLVPRDLILQTVKIFETCNTYRVGGVQTGGFLVQALDPLLRYVTDLTVNLDDAYRKLK